MPAPVALVIGAGLIAGALLVTPLINRYSFDAAQLGGFWRFDRLTGEAVLCLVENNPFDMACSRPHRPEDHVIPQR